MMTPIYEAEQTAMEARTVVQNDNDSNYGVWFDRFFEYQIFKPSGKFVDENDIEYLISSEDGKVQNTLRSKMNRDEKEIYKQGKKKQKKDFLSSFLGNDGQRKCGNDMKLKDHAMRQYALCQAQCGISHVYSNDWQMAIGLGNSHPLENGLLWHPTLGVPYFQGSTLKGLAKALMEKWGADPKLIKRWFGSVNLLTTPNFEDKSEAFIKYFDTSLTDDLKKVLDEQETGAFIFMDAVPTQQVMIKQTMVTPHYSKWYEKGDSAPKARDTLPGDWHSPVPVEFMVVEKAVMQFSVIPRLGAEVKEGELEQISNVIKLALEHLGIGGKTATGFGRMHFQQEDSNNLSKAFEALIMTDEEKIINDFVEHLENMVTSWRGKPNVDCGFMNFYREVLTWEDKNMLKKGYDTLIEQGEIWQGKKIRSNKKWKDRLKIIEDKLF